MLSTKVKDRSSACAVLSVSVSSCIPPITKSLPCLLLVQCLGTCWILQELVSLRLKSSENGKQEVLATPAGTSYFPFSELFNLLQPFFASNMPVSQC